MEHPGRGDGDDAPVVEVQLAVTGDGVESALRRECPDAGIVVVEVAVLAEEIVRDAPGQQVMLDRLLDVLLVSTLRRWFTGLAEEAPAWFRASDDPIVGPAVRALHDDPARTWTVAELGREVGVSRALLARRFSAVMGEPPMSYLTSWRLALAADLLLDPGATLGSVAPRVGYASPYALSTAFRRVRGATPREHRAAGAAG